MKMRKGKMINERWWKNEMRNENEKWKMKNEKADTHRWEN